MRIEETIFWMRNIRELKKLEDQGLKKHILSRWHNSENPTMVMVAQRLQWNNFESHTKRLFYIYRRWWRVEHDWLGQNFRRSGFTKPTEKQGFKCIFWQYTFFANVEVIAIISPCYVKHYNTEVRRAKVVWLAKTSIFKYKKVLFSLVMDTWSHKWPLRRYEHILVLRQMI